MIHSRRKPVRSFWYCLSEIGQSLADSRRTGVFVIASRTYVSQSKIVTCEMLIQEEKNRQVAAPLLTDCAVFRNLLPKDSNDLTVNQISRAPTTGLSLIRSLSWSFFDPD